MEATTTTTTTTVKSSSAGSGSHSAPCPTSGTIREAIKNENEQQQQEQQPPSQPASWRMNPEESLSDWTIEIKTTTSPHDSEDDVDVNNDDDDDDDDNDDTNIVTTYKYNVHRYVLAVGPRRSDYFARLFQQDARFAESRKKTSRIRLQSLAAGAFPLFLDYLYLPGPPPDDYIIATKSATALHSLAEYFGVPRLRWDVLKFVKSDLDMNRTCATYYEHAKTLMNETILQTVIEFGVENITRLVSTSRRRRLIQATDARFWLAIVQNAEVAKRGVGWPQLSPIITEFCRHYQSELSGKTFQQLTDRQHLPIIRVHNALALLELERVLVGKNAAGTTPYKLSSLQERCVSTIACNWEILDLDEASTQQQLEKQPSAVLTKISALIVAAAKDKIQADRARLEAKYKAKSTELTTVNWYRVRIAVVSDEEDDEDWPGIGEFYFV